MLYFGSEMLLHVIQVQIFLARKIQYTPIFSVSPVFKNAPFQPSQLKKHILIILSHEQ